MRGSRKKFRLHNKLVRMDSTSIDLCASLFDWSRYKHTKGAAKVHMLLDHNGYYQVGRFWCRQSPRRRRVNTRPRRPLTNSQRHR